jgi:NitT/TauT family transport system substrate-binding protein
MLSRSGYPSSTGKYELKMMLEWEFWLTFSMLILKCCEFLAVRHHCLSRSVCPLPIRYFIWNTSQITQQNPMRRRSLLKVGAGTLLVSLTTSCRPQRLMPSTASNINATDQPPLIIGYATVASALPLFCAVEKGFFRELGLAVEIQKMTSPQRTVEGLISDRLHGCSNGTATGSLALAAGLSPDLFRIIASNSSNQTWILDEIIVGQDSPIRTIAELNGKTIACGMGPQNLAIAQALLAKNGAKAQQIIQMELGQHVAAVNAGQVAAAYTLEPNGTIGTQKKLTRTLESGVVAKYILNDPQAPWFGGTAVLSKRLIKNHPELAQKYVTAYRQGVEFVRQQPDAARKFLVGYTPVSDELSQLVPIVDYRMYDEFTPADLNAFQKFIDFLHDAKVLSKPLAIAPLLYRPSGG